MVCTCCGVSPFLSCCPSSRGRGRNRRGGTQRCIPRTRLSNGRRKGARGEGQSCEAPRGEPRVHSPSPVGAGARAMRARFALPGAAHALRRLECLSLSPCLSLSCASAPSPARPPRDPRRVNPWLKLCAVMHLPSHRHAGEKKRERRIGVARCCRAAAGREQKEEETTGWSCLEWWPEATGQHARTQAPHHRGAVCAHTRGHDAHLSGERLSPSLSWRRREGLTGAQVSFAGPGGGGGAGDRAPTPPLLHSTPEEMAFHDPETDMPGSRGALAQFAFKDSMIHGVLQFTLRIAVCCVLHRCKSQDIHRCELCFGFGFFHASAPPSRGRRSHSCKRFKGVFFL